MDFCAGKEFRKRNYLQVGWKKIDGKKRDGKMKGMKTMDEFFCTTDEKFD